MNIFSRPVRDASSKGSSGNFTEYEADCMPLSMRLDLVRRFGDQSLSYSAATQTGLKHFGNKDGFIAFQTKFGQTFALANPVVAPENREQLILAFLKRYRKAAFVQVSEEMAEVLSVMKFWVNEMGVDTNLDLSEYNFQGKEKERFRYAANWLIRRDYKIQELPFDDRVIKQTRALGKRWRDTRSVKHETAFINRPIEYNDQPDMRRFFLLNPAGDVAAFVFFDPLYRSGRVVGYVTSFKRRDIDCPSMAELGICKVAIEKFIEEGKLVVKLGLSPLAQIEDEKFRHNWMMKRSFRFVYSAGWVNRYFYNVQGHAEFKNRFRGEVEKTYFASSSFINDFRLFALMRLSKIL